MKQGQHELMIWWDIMNALLGGKTIAKDHLCEVFDGHGAVIL
jgi:hypothetical protein